MWRTSAPAGSRRSSSGVLDDLSFSAPDRSGEQVVIDATYVRERVADLAKNADLSRFIL